MEKWDSSLKLRLNSSKNGRASKSLRRSTSKGSDVCQTTVRQLVLLAIGSPTPLRLGLEWFFFFGKMVWHLSFSLRFPEVALVAKRAEETQHFKILLWNTYFNRKQKSILFSTYLFFVFHGELWFMWSSRGQGHSANGEDVGKLDHQCSSTKGHPTRKQTNFFEAVCG